jgi:membrane-associated phospholipid phosphatase
MLARLISVVLHPFLVCPAAIVMLLWLDLGDPRAALRWAALCSAMVVLPALVWLALAVRRQRYSDPDVSVRSQRHGFYVFGMVCMVLCYGALLWLGAPAVLLAGFTTAVLAVLLGALTNRFWTKVSIHAGAVVGVAAATIPYSLPLALVLGAVAAVVAWARVVTGRHTTGQTVAGGAIALACVLVGFLPWL